MKLLILICIVSFGFSGDKKMSATPSNKGSIKLENELKVVDEEGFYKSIISTVSPNNKYIIYDDGNKQLFVFSSEGSVINSFGKEGSGPGEFSRVRRLYANEDYIYVRAGRKIMIFKYDGSLVREISEHISFGGDLVIFKDRLTMYYTSSKFQKFSKVDFSLDGKTLKTYTNSSFDVSTQANRGRRMSADGMKAMFTQVRGLIKTEKGFVRFYPGEYRFERLDEFYKVTNLMHRDYKRLKETQDPDWMNNWKQRAGNNKKAQERRAKFQQTRNQITGGYLSDITGILGVVNGYVFIQTSASDRNTVSIDVISENNELYDQISIKGDEVLSASIRNNKLLINYQNEEDGPYLKSFEVNAGKNSLVNK
jgi:hypothetical protein